MLTKLTDLSVGMSDDQWDTVTLMLNNVCCTINILIWKKNNPNGIKIFEQEKNN